MKIIPTYLLPVAAALAILADPTPTQATLAEACDNLNREACEQIAKETAGQCASPGGLGGCRFDSLITY